MNTDITNKVLAEVIAKLDIPDSAYEKAEKRYKDLYDWVSGPSAECSKYSPHVYSQGSFRLGTVNRPLDEDGEYDLDVGCRLRTGITKSSHTQKQLKDMVGRDLESYRKARNIGNPLEEKHRCWRLGYADEMSFHLDTVPSIPEAEAQRGKIVEGMIKAGAAKDLAENVGRHAGAITDNRNPNYAFVSPVWLISNSEGYAIWFESRIRMAASFLADRVIQAKKAKIDELPARSWKSPLQQAVQILKRHRDVMFQDDPDGQPISIIITTLAAYAYQGERDLASALERILKDMHLYVSPTLPRVANPVNRDEDFADKWSNPKYQKLRLEDKFWTWLKQARADFSSLADSRDADFLAEQMSEKLAVSVGKETLSQKLGLVAPAVITTSKVHTITGTPAKPWSSDEK